jgi:hypothetical protein
MVDTQKVAGTGKMAETQKKWLTQNIMADTKKK